MISLTERAAVHVRRYMQDGRVLRLGVRRAGCSGYQYVVESGDAPGDSDRVFESQGVTVVVDEQNLPFLMGTELDYRKQGLNEGFTFSNPNAGDTCGCGESFTVREDL